MTIKDQIIEWAAQQNIGPYDPELKDLLDITQRLADENGDLKDEITELEAHAKQLEDEIDNLEDEITELEK